MSTDRLDAIRRQVTRIPGAVGDDVAFLLDRVDALEELVERGTETMDHLELRFRQVLGRKPVLDATEVLAASVHWIGRARHALSHVQGEPGPKDGA